MDKPAATPTGFNNKGNKDAKGDIVDTSHPILVLVRGIPGSGKSFLSKALHHALEGKTKVVTVDPDSTNYTSKAYLAMSKDLAAQGVDPKFHPYRFIRAKAHQGIDDNAIVIWNQPFTNLDGFQKTIKNLRAYAAEQHPDLSIPLPILVVEVEVDPTLAKQRVVARKNQGGHGPSEATFNRFLHDYTSFATEGHPTVTVNGTDDTAVSISTIIKALETL